MRPASHPSRPSSPPLPHSYRGHVARDDTNRRAVPGQVPLRSKSRAVVSGRGGRGRCAAEGAAASPLRSVVRSVRSDPVTFELRNHTPAPATASRFMRLAGGLQQAISLVPQHFFRAIKPAHPPLQIRPSLSRRNRAQRLRSLRPCPRAEEKEYRPLSDSSSFEIVAAALEHVTTAPRCPWLPLVNGVVSSALTPITTPRFFIFVAVPNSCGSSTTKATPVDQKTTMFALLPIIPYVVTAFPSSRQCESPKAVTDAQACVGRCAPAGILKTGAGWGGGADFDDDRRRSLRQTRAMKPPTLPRWICPGRNWARSSLEIRCEPSSPERFLRRHPPRYLTRVEASAARGARSFGRLRDNYKVATEFLRAIAEPPDAVLARTPARTPPRKPQRGA